MLTAKVKFLIATVAMQVGCRLPPGGNGQVTAPARESRHFLIVKTLLLKSKTLSQSTLDTLTV